MPGTPETFGQDTFITAGRGKLTVNWQQLGFSKEPNSVGAEHVNSYHSLKNFSKSFHPTQDPGRFNRREQSPHVLFFEHTKNRLRGTSNRS